MIDSLFVCLCALGKASAVPTDIPLWFRGLAAMRAVSMRGESPGSAGAAPKHYLPVGALLNFSSMIFFR
jgi:hypothetical protein